MLGEILPSAPPPASRLRALRRVRHRRYPPAQRLAASRRHHRRSRSGRSGSRRSISRRTGRTCAASSSTAGSDGQAASASTTSGSATGARNGSWRETNVRFEGPAVTAAAGGVRRRMGRSDRRAGDRPRRRRPARGRRRRPALLHTSPTLGEHGGRAVSCAVDRRRPQDAVHHQRVLRARRRLRRAAAARRPGAASTCACSPPVPAPMSASSVRRARACTTRCSTAGVRVYEWQPSTLHAKTFVVDGEWSTIGSMNFDNRSLALNDEATLMVLDRAIERPDGRGSSWTISATRRRSRLRCFGQRSWIERWPRGRTPHREIALSGAAPHGRGAPIARIADETPPQSSCGVDGNGPSKGPSRSLFIHPAAHRSRHARVIPLLRPLPAGVRLIAPGNVFLICREEKEQPEPNLAKCRKRSRRFATRRFLITRYAARSHRSDWPHS